MLRRPRTGSAQADLNDALALLAGLFGGARYESLSPPYVFLADTLIDVYGEDLRPRAFIFPDPGRGNELCLRPDFTVPVTLAHAEGGWDRSAAYSYQGPVFRNQPQGMSRPVEYVQAGIERFGDRDETAADAAVFVLLHRALAALGVGRPQATIGDLSIPFALLDALPMPPRRRAALRRHFWRRERFQNLLARAQQPTVSTTTRTAMLQAAGAPDRIAAMMAEAGERVGVRTVGDVAERAGALLAEQEDPPMPAGDAALIDDLMAIKGPARDVSQRLRALTDRVGIDIGATIDTFERRLSLIEAAGVPPDDLVFDASFGRNLEYYDGFVFEMRANGVGDHPPLSGGGRYDALTRRLGAATPVPAVGGMIRPEAVLEARS